MSDKKLNGFGISITGAAHVRNNMGNQDSVCVYTDSDKNYVVASVCDGHGGEKFIRSQIGADIAARETTQLLCEFYVSNPNFKLENEKTRTEKIDRLKKNILYYWHTEVQQYNEDHPITDQEFAQIADKKSLKACEEVKDNNMTAYGTTLIAALVSEDFLLCLQLGDGDVVFLYPDASKENPMEADERLLANETTSLCSDSAILDFRVKYFADHLPELMLLSTDGISNSFVTYDDFLNLAYDIKEGLLQDGEDKTKRSLEEGLQRLTNTGSGDDVTIAVAWGMI